MSLPEGNWNVYITGEVSGVEALASVEGAVSVDPISAMVLVKEDLIVKEPRIQLAFVDLEEPSAEEDTDDTKTGKNKGIVIGAAVAAVTVAGAAAAVILKKKK